MTLRQQMVDKRLAARQYTRTHATTPTQVRDWVWPGAHGATFGAVGATESTGGDSE